MFSRLVIAAFAALLALSLPVFSPQALAQTGSNFPTPTAGQNAAGAVNLGVNGSGQAVPSGTPASIQVTIANATSLSPAIDLGAGSTRLVRVVIPGAWTAANLTFQTSHDCASYNDFYDNAGTEYTLTVGGPTRAVLVPYVDFIGIRCFKIRSGTTGVPVAQGADRILNLAVIP